MKDEKKKYLVRTSCEYSLLVEAENEKEALAVAKDTYKEQWEQAWSEYEVEDYK